MMRLAFTTAEIRSGGMHQPVPDPVDAETLNPRDLLRWLCSVQRSFSDWPFTKEVAVSQWRPGVIVICDDPDAKGNRIVVGLDVLLEQMEAKGMIEQRGGE